MICQVTGKAVKHLVIEQYGSLVSVLLVSWQDKPVFSFTETKLDSNVKLGLSYCEELGSP